MYTEYLIHVYYKTRYVTYPSSVGNREFLATMLIIGTSLPNNTYKIIYINASFSMVVVINSRDRLGKIWLPKNAPENNLVIIISIGTPLSIPKMYSNIENTH